MLQLDKKCIAMLMLCCFWGCGPGSSDGDGNTDVNRDAYPEGPYGVEEGDILDNLSFTEPDGSAFAFENVFSDPENKLLLLSTAAGWCTACREEQGALQSLQETHGDAGLYVMVTIFEDNSSIEVEDAFVQAWIEEYDLTIKVVGDAPFVMSNYYDSSLTPMNMIVDINTMEIVRKTTGWDPSTIDAIIEAKLY